MREPHNQVYKTVVLVWLVLSMASVLLAAVTWFQLWSRFHAAGEAMTIQTEVDTILRLLLDAETGQRGFTITGDDRFLEVQRAAETSLPVHFDRLTGLVREDDVMLHQIMDLNAQAEVSMNYHREVIAARSKQGFEAAAKLVATGEGKRLMDGLRARVAAIRGMRADLAIVGSGVARSQLIRASWTSLVAGALGIGAGLLAFLLARLTWRHQERERQLVEARLQAERNSREKTVFLANMSHEIRTPMNAILGFGELLAGQLPDGKHRQYVQSIRSSARSLLQLINDILDMSKVEAGVMELRPEPTDPREICDFVQTVFSTAATKKGVRLQCHVAEDLPRALLVDRIRLRQILVNLVGNAVKFTDQGTIDVRVTWEREDRTSQVVLIVEVQDTGVGIPKDKLEAIFEPFTQSGVHREKERQGTGLGLSIVKRLTELMGGSVTVASEPGHGSAFHLRFPHVAISTRLPSTEATDNANKTNFDALQPSKLLVVDDNETNCELVAAMFEGTHHKLIFGSSGQEAVTLARQAKPDVILLDIRMSGMDGREALAEIRKIPTLELVPVLAVTASSLLKEEMALREQFNGYIRKPFTGDELFRELAQFLPAQPASDSRAKAPPEDAEAAKDSGGQPISGELVAELRRKVQVDWPAVCASLAINETRAFAETLVVLGSQGNLPQLVRYARDLLRHADNYDVVELERHLQGFSSLVQRLERRGSR